MGIEVPLNFQTANESNSKDLVVVVTIEGLDDILSSATVGTRILYGDPILYGDISPSGEPYVYGGLRPYLTDTGGVARPYLQLENSSVTIDQRLEPEQGRASISQMTLSFTDKDQYMTRIISPGVVLDEILGKVVNVYQGYSTISYPQDFIRVFRGRVQGIQALSGRVVLQLGDPNLVRRQQIFYSSITNLASGISDSTTTIPVVDNSDFTRKIQGPDGVYDTTVRCYLKIDDEFIEYQQTGFESSGFGSNQFVSVVRGARGTSAAAHDVDADVTCFVQVEDHPITIALKLMLSGWGGPFLTGVPIKSFVFTNDPDVGDQPDAFVVEVDAVNDLGLATGDFVTITGATNPANNITGGVIEDFGEVNGMPNRLVYIASAGFVFEATTSAVAALRSQYDTYPDNLGIKMNPNEVDVAGHEAVRDQFTVNEEMRFFIGSALSSGKDFIEKELFLPMGAYSITRAGQVSVKITLPPVADERLQVLSNANVIEPQSIALSRSTTNRKFFNDISFTYDYDDAGTPRGNYRAIDFDSINEIAVRGTLPIDSKGTHTDLTSLSVIASRATRFLTRYKRGCVLVDLSAQFGVSNILEAGDVVVLQDPETLQISNITTGGRGLGTQLFELLNRTLDIKTGKGKLTLLSGINFSLTDIFATWAPSSMVASAGNSFTQVTVLPSYGEKYGTREFRKWQDYVGMTIRIHDEDYNDDEEATLTAVSQTNVLTFDPPISFVPDDTHIVDLAAYSTDPSTDPIKDEFSKIVHCFWDRAAPVVTGVSATQFTVGAGDAQFFRVGYPLKVVKNDYSAESPEVMITNVSGVTITCEALGFTPDSTYNCQLLSWYDARGPYRWV